MTSTPAAVGRPGLGEPLGAFIAVTAVASALFWIGRAVPFINENLHGMLAVLFLYAPSVAARISKRPFDYRLAGLRGDPIGRNLATAGLGVVVTWPVFLIGFLGFYTAICAPHTTALLQFWAEVFAPLCSRWRGWGGASFSVPDDFLLLALSQLIVVALPEEFFFRGYLFTRLEERWPPRRRFLGAPVGWSLVISSALFGLGHILVDFAPARLAVFGPGLIFGWMRSRTGSIAAGTIFHALCNLFSEVLHTSFF